MKMKVSILIMVLFSLNCFTSKRKFNFGIKTKADPCEIISDEECKKFPSMEKDKVQGLCYFYLNNKPKCFWISSYRVYINKTMEGKIASINDYWKKTWKTNSYVKYVDLGSAGVQTGLKASELSFNPLSIIGSLLSFSAAKDLEKNNADMTNKQIQFEINKTRNELVQKFAKSDRTYNECPNDDCAPDCCLFGIEEQYTRFMHLVNTDMGYSKTGFCEELVTLSNQISNYLRFFLDGVQHQDKANKDKFSKWTDLVKWDLDQLARIKEITDDVFNFSYKMESGCLMNAGSKDLLQQLFDKQTAACTSKSMNFRIINVVKGKDGGLTTEIRPPTKFISKIPFIKNVANFSTCEADKPIIKDYVLVSK